MTASGSAESAEDAWSTDLLPLAIRLAARLRIDKKDGALQIDDPDFQDARPRIKPQLHFLVVAQRGLGYLDQQNDILRTRMAEPVEVASRTQDGDVGLRLAMEIENNRVLCPQDAMFTETGAESRDQETDGAGVSTADRRHVDHLPLDQLDPGVRGEHPGLAHAVVVEPRSTDGVGRCFRLRRTTRCSWGSQFSLSCANRALNACAGHYSSKI